MILQGSLRFKCTFCQFSTHTKRGLKNHSETHRRNASVPNISLPQMNRGRNRRARELLTNAQRRARGDPAWSAIHDPPEIPTENRFSPIDPDNDQSTPVDAQQRLRPTVQRPQHWEPPLDSNSSHPTSQASATSSTTISQPSQLPDNSPQLETAVETGVDGEDQTNETSQPIPQDRNEPEDLDPLAEFSDILSGIISHLDDPQAWDIFETTIREITEAIGTIVNLPQERNSGTPFTPQQIDTGSCRVIQRLYRRNRRRAIRLIVDGESARCHLPAAQLQHHFEGIFAERQHDPSVFEDSFPTGHPEIDTSPFSPSEVRSRLHRFENSAPGPDRITYAHLKEADPDCRILAKILNICLRAKRIPSSWKHSRTILIHKKDDIDDPSNWRPISLCNTIYKLYTGCLASRLVSWLVDYEVLSFTQKGFMPFDGVFEHRYIVQQTQTTTKMNRSELCMAQIDLTNAFGSIPHAAIFSALQAAGAGSHFSEVIEDLYSNSSTEILAGDGVTDSIHIRAGVRQGCPISGILFNIVVDPVLRSLQDQRPEHHVLAFADDISLLENSPPDLQRKLDSLCSLLNKLSLEVNPRKCASFHLSGTTPVGMRPTSFTVASSPIRALEDGEESTFLGTPVGFHLGSNLQSINDFLKLGERIMTSKLAPWQRIDALKTFFFPAFVFKMRTDQVSKTDMKIIDDFLRPLLKRTLYIDDNAANEYLYGSSNLGLLGIPRLAEEVDIMRIDSAFKLLTSKDQAIQDLAWGDLLLHANRRTGLEPSAELAEKFLNGTQDEEGFSHTSTPYSSTWSLARAASTRLNIKWRCREVGDIELHTNEKVLGPHQRTRICHTIKEELRVKWSNDLIAKPSQGAAIEVSSQHKSSNHFLRTGEFTKFADWRFIHKARLNLLRLNANTPWDNNNQSCRRCLAPRETTLHVLSLCKPNMGRRTTRHNAIVERIIKAKKRDWRIVSTNQVVGDEGLRPDIVLEKGDEAIILDITVPYENRTSAFVSAREEKRRKYRSVASFLSSRYTNITVDAIIVGALGSWDPANEPILKRFVNKRYLKKLRKLCVSETISHTREIFQKHVLGHVPSGRPLNSINELPEIE